MSDFPYVWTWRWRTWTFPGVTARVPWFGDGIDRKGWPCRVLARSTAGNSALIEFADGTRFVTSRGGIRRAATSRTQTSPNLTTESATSRRSHHAVD